MGRGGGAPAEPTWDELTPRRGGDHPQLRAVFKSASPEDIHIHHIPCKKKKITSRLHDIEMLTVQGEFRICLFRCLYFKSYCTILYFVPNVILVEQGDTCTSMSTQYTLNPERPSL